MTSPRRIAWPAAAIVVVALAVRLFALDSQSLWYDEGLTVSLARRSLATIARNAADDVHPPLYYWLLAGWVRLVGDSAFAVRAFSAMAGTVLVALVVALGVRLWSPRVGLIAGIVAVISPFLVWYSQEARMYMLAALVGAAMVWVVLDLGGRLAPAGAADRTVGPWLVLLALEIAALHTHYVGGAGAVAVANVVAAWFVARAITRRRKRLRSPGAAARVNGAHRSGDTPDAHGTGVGRWIGTWLVVQLAALLCTLPWLRLAWPALSQWPATSPPFTLPYALLEAGRVFALGTRVPAHVAAWWLAWTALAVVGATRRDRAFGYSAAVVAGAWAATPPLLLWLTSLSRPAWEAKQIIVGAPGFELLAAAGIVQASAAGGALAWWVRDRWPRLRAVRRPAGAMAVVVLLAAAYPRLVCLAAPLGDPAFRRDDYRGIAAAIAAAAAPADAVLLNAPTQVEVFEYYDRTMHAAYPLPRTRPPDAEATERELSAILGAHRDLYAVLWATDQSDPDGVVERVLNERRNKAFDRWYGNVRLAMWAAPRAEGGPFALPRSVPFGDEIALVSAQGGAEEVPAGDVLTFELGWRPLRRPRVDYTVFAQLLDREGRIAAQRDMRPRGGSEATSTWAPVAGSPVVLDNVGLVVPPDTPPGEYRLIVGLYDPESGRRLPVDGGAAEGIPDAYEVALVRVRPVASRSPAR